MDYLALLSHGVLSCPSVMEPMTLSNLLTHPGFSGWKARTAKVETGGYRSRLGETCTMGAPFGREKAAATEVDTIFDFIERWN